jgi:hypothetical protein
MQKNLPRSIYYVVTELSARKSSFIEPMIVIALSLLLTAVDIEVSLRLGLLAYPPYYDGVSYLLQSRQVYSRIVSNPMLLFRDPYYVLSPLGLSPLWNLLILLNFFLFGIGEWQAYAVRFWPTLMLLLVVLFVTKRRNASSELRWIAVRQSMPTHRTRPSLRLPPV